MQAILEMIMNFIISFMSLIGEEVPSFVVEWMESLKGTDEDSEGAEEPTV